jgi:Domain of unknown function (DUF4349)
MRASRAALSALVVTALLGTAACSGTQEDSGSATEGGSVATKGEPDATPAASAATPAGATPAAATGAKDAIAGEVAASLQRSIIRTASLTVRTKTVAATVTKAEDAATGLGGLVGDANINTDPDKPDQTSATLELRVPNPAYDQLMTALSNLGSVVHKTEKASDVTSQVVDVNSRLATQRKSLEQVRALLGHAGTLPQVLLVEQDLTRREADLESLEAQQKVLADQTSLATIDLTLVTPKAAPTPPPPARRLGFTTGLLAGWHGLSNTAVVTATAVGAALPFGLPLLVIGVLALVLWRRRTPTGSGIPATADAD